MKINKYLAFSFAIFLGLSSCSLDTETFDQKDSGTAFSTLKDIDNSLNGTYYRLGHYYFLGNYAVSLGDMCAGISAGNASSGHMYALSSFTFSDTQEEIEDVWNVGYKIVANSTKTINAANVLIDNGTIKESELPLIKSYIAQCYALKSLANYYLVNLFALPYSETNKSKLGIIVIDKDVPEALSSVKRGTIEETYSQILKDIKSSEDAFKEAGSKVTSKLNAYYMGTMGLEALKARVNLSLGNYAVAEAAAKEALTIRNNGDGKSDDEIPSDSKYLSMWGNVAINDEDIFTIKKSDDDNLSANSINTLYGSYYGTIQNTVIKKISANDIRKQLFIASKGGGTTTTKFIGKSADAVSNIPIFRKSEMSLIIAECEARIGTIANAKDYLMFTAKRDKDMTIEKLPSTKEALLTFISDERMREFFAEGHRFYDARRMGDLVSADQFSNWDIKKFVFPIPAAEINTGTGCTQNVDWSDNFPSLEE